MNLWQLVKKELSHKKFGFVTGVLSLAAATAAVVAGSALLAGHDMATARMRLDMEKQLRKEMTEQEDYYRRVMRDMGHNVLIINEEQDEAELRNLGHPTTYLDYDDVWKLAHAGIETLNHLLPVLQERIFWEERETEIMLSGIRGQVPVFSKPEFLTDEDEYRSPIVERVPEGKADLGYTVATRLGLRPGEAIEIKGEEFTVNRVYPQRGTTDDIAVWIPLDMAQGILGREGKINGIFALECVCELDELGMVTEEVRSVLPHARVYEFTSLIDARHHVRGRAEEAHREVVASVMSHREASREEMERFASLVVPFLAAGAGIWIFVLIFNNMRERRGEIGILRAVGFLRTSVLAIFLMKAAIMGIAGGVLGCIIGAAAGVGWSAVDLSGAAFTELVRPAVIAAGLLLAPVLSLAAAFIPAVLAANQDPAAILREE